MAQNRYPWHNSTEDIAQGADSQWETPGGAQEKADQAEANAKAYSDQRLAEHVGTGGNAHALVVPNGAAGFMSGSDKSKLDGIQPGAQVNAVKTVAGRTGDVVIGWNDVQNRPASSTTDIDDAVTKRHTHSNKSTLDAIEEPFTTADKNKLDGIQAGAEVNQNAFAQINDILATSKSDTLNLVGGTGIAISTNPTTKTATITATGEAVPGPHALTHITGGSDVIPNAEPNGNAGLMSGADKARLDASASAADLEALQSDLSAHIGSGGAAHASATSGSAGFMSSADKTKLDAATSAATPNTLVQRDANGRFKAAAPSASDDVARKAETDAAMSAAQAAQNTANAALPKSGGIVDGTLLVNGNGGISHFNWLTMSSAGTGDVLYGQNCYIDTLTGQYKFKNTHESMGARGIVLRWSTDQQALIPYWFNTGRRATTAGEVFTPNLIPFITAQGGQTIDGEITVRKNGHNYVTIATQGSGNPNLRLLAEGLVEWLIYTDRADNGLLKIRKSSTGSDFMSFGNDIRAFAKIVPRATAGIIGNSDGSRPVGLEIQGASASDAAYILFHRPGSHAVYFGLDTDNEFRIGGFSLGNASYKLWSEKDIRNNNGVLEFNNGGVWTPVGGVKSVQRGSTTTYFYDSDPDPESTNYVYVNQIDVPISAVNVNKAYVVVTSGYSNGNNHINSPGTNYRAELLNATTVRVYAAAPNNNNLEGVTVHWQVVEFY